MRTPKGTRVLYPKEAERRRSLREKVEEEIRKYGYKNIITPSIEKVDLYKQKSGEDIVKGLFLLDENIGSERLALTPEITPTIGKIVADEYQRLKEPIKFYSTQRFWRYEEPQKGRFREFWQTNIDIFGVKEPYSEVELIKVAVDILSSLGITEDEVEIRISDRRLLEKIISEFAPSENTESIMRIVDKREKLEEKEFKDMLIKKGVSRVEKFIELLEIDRVSEISDYKEANNLYRLFENLQEAEVDEWITLDISTARGLDYYTGIVFEAFDKKNIINRSLLGGGRYNNLIQNYNGKTIPSSGFAIGYAPLEEALEGYNISLQNAATKVYIIKFEDTSEINTQISKCLRNQGYIVEENLKGNSISSQFDTANSKNYDYVIVPGPEEVSEGEVKIKNLENGKEKDVSIESLRSIDIDSLFN